MLREGKPKTEMKMPDGSKRCEGKTQKGHRVSSGAGGVTFMEVIPEARRAAETVMDQVQRAFPNTLRVGKARIGDTEKKHLRHGKTVCRFISY